jgi:hypothetical protein
MLKVIGAGLARTGTTSMKAALERLGFGPCYHMFEILMHPDHVERWLPVAAGPSVDWNAVFAGYLSTQDWPASHFWRELADTYPDAKVVLTVRDPHAWYPSLRTLMLNGPAMFQDASPDMSPAMSPPTGAGAAIEQLRPLLARISQAYFGSDWSLGADLPDEQRAVEAFHRHQVESADSHTSRPFTGVRRPAGVGAAVFVSRRTGTGRRTVPAPQRLRLAAPSTREHAIRRPHALTVH